MPEPSQEEIIPPTERDPGADALAALDHVASKLGRDERRVLTRIGERLALGAVVYGRLHIASDPRSWKRLEAREEIEDALVYFACAWLKGEEVAS